MSTSAKPLKLNQCGCCEAGSPEAAIHNRPGLAAIGYRIGTHSTFMRHMLARLPAPLLPDGPTLRALTTRQSNDFTISLLDAWAVVADVLTFYQERIANEGFLRTATERRSVLELARAIGYELNPGVAASTYLAFTVEDAEGAPSKAMIKEGTQVLSVPGQDERPQTFETVETIEAHVEWNALRPLQSELRIPGFGDKVVYLKAIDTGLRPGDPLLFIGRERAGDPGSERWDFRRAASVEAFVEEGYTRVTWTEGLGWTRLGRTILPAEREFTVYTFRQRASLFGHNAPDFRMMPESIKSEFDDSDADEWKRFDLSSETIIHLDNVYSEIVPGSWVVLSIRDYEEVYKVLEVEEESQVDFTLTAKVTRLRVSGENLLAEFGERRRDTRVFAQSVELEMAETPLVTPIFGDRIRLERSIEGLAPKRPTVVSGKRISHVRVSEYGDPLTLSDEAAATTRALEPGETLEVLEPPLTTAGGLLEWRLRNGDGAIGTVTAGPEDLIPEPVPKGVEPVTEVGLIERIELDSEDRTILILKAPLKNVYDRTTVTISANVAAATHGESVKDEVLGGGDGARANQRFGLKQRPLTYVSAPTPSGAQSTLELRVDNVRWEELPSLYDLRPDSRNFVVRLDDDGNADVIFGDGLSGARLPSGAENIRATYRASIGLQGEVDARTLNLLRTRPLGIREVTNPIPATGAADPARLEEARENAPRTVLTLDRVVSLRDYEEFARGFAGIGKAQATVLWNGDRRLVHITVASTSGEAVDPTSSLYTNLIDAINQVRDPVQEVLVHSYRLREFKIEVGLLVDEAYIVEKVYADVQAALEEAFSFEARRLGQPVTATETIALVQAIPGVVAGDLNQLFFVEDGGAAPTASLSSFLEARGARIEDGDLLPAELLRLARDGVALTEMSA